MSYVQSFLALHSLFTGTKTRDYEFITGSLIAGLRLQTGHAFRQLSPMTFKPPAPNCLCGECVQVSPSQFSTQACISRLEGAERLWHSLSLPSSRTGDKPPQSFSTYSQFGTHLVPTSLRNKQTKQRYTNHRSQTNLVERVPLVLLVGSSPSKSKTLISVNLVVVIK